MTGIFDKFTKKTSGSQSTQGEQEQSFSIQPHPATTNDPADLQRQPGQGGGLNSARDPAFAAHQAAPGPVINPEVGNVAVSDKDELKARSAALNPGQK